MMRRRPGEFELIAKLFAPLSSGMPGAFGLTDDVALFAPCSGQEIVLKADSLIEGVHFLRADPPETVGRKALRRALSDLAAKGADPSCYLLALALPDWPDAEWLERFAGGLASDQAEFGVVLAGGETNRTPGPLALTITAVGNLPEGTLIRRSGARAGDIVFVTGTIGDAGAGLALARGHASDAPAATEYLLSRYRLPQPRLAFGRALRGIASSSIDISDGLLGDLEHVARTSGVRIEIDADRVPLSPALREFAARDPDAIVRAATAGDDYEIAFTAPASRTTEAMEVARRTSTPVTPIGRAGAGNGAVLRDANGLEIAVSQTGYTHF